MWIRSQNKYYLMNCKNVIAYQNIKMNKFVVITNDGTDVTLGIYSTKEKVLKVLDMIQEHIKNMYVGTGNFMGYPFQMPQDDEVENE